MLGSPETVTGIETDMFRFNKLTGPQAEQNHWHFLAHVPMSWLGAPDEIAVAIAFFLDRRASFVTAAGLAGRAAHRANHGRG